jgi:Asp-tRNA(Asn)/Glu-tRNA(Gln) amidotransferase C subunit
MTYKKKQIRNENMDTETVTTTLDPRRSQVANLVDLALSEAAEDQRGQLIADMVMAISIVANVADVDITDMQHMVDAAASNAKKAGDHLLANSHRIGRTYHDI